MAFGDQQLEDLVCVGLTTATTAYVWAHAGRPGAHRIRVYAPSGAVTDHELDLTTDGLDDTGALTVTRGIEASGVHRVTLLRDGKAVAHAQFHTPPARDEDPPRRWSFAAMSCHQPFADDGEPTASARSMLTATLVALEEADVRFVLMMGDQAYADLPENASVFDDEYFRTLAPPGRERLLECSAAEIRAIYQQRHRIFWGMPEFTALMSRFSSIPMIDDHEIVDNFGTHPDHATLPWESLRHGALDAAFDYQLSRVLPRSADGGRPVAFDWSFRWGQVAVWGMDVRTQRRTRDDVTTVYTPAQWSAFAEFLAHSEDAGVLVVMTPIPLVHIDGHIITVASHLIGRGSDMHERWSHPQCLEARNRFVGVLLAHAHRNPRQRILLLGGDVHSGAAFQIDFDDGVQLYQLTSSPVTHAESWLAEKVSEYAGRTVSELALPDGPCASVGLVPGLQTAADNPVGRVNVGIVDVIEHEDRVGLRLRLIGHDDAGHPLTLFDSGELGRAPPPAQQKLGVQYAGP